VLTRVGGKNEKILFKGFKLSVTACMYFGVLMHSRVTIVINNVEFI
jgi:hypothetical protein